MEHREQNRTVEHGEQDRTGPCYTADLELTLFNKLHPPWRLLRGMTQPAVTAKTNQENGAYWPQMTCFSSQGCEIMLFGY